MKTPRLPPRLDGSRTAEVIEKMFKPSVQEYIAKANKEYYHWEKLRHIPTPEQLTPEQGWWLVKMNRGQWRSLPLLDKTGRPFKFWLGLPAQDILHEVDRWGGTTLRVAEGSQATFGSMRDRILISSLMEEAIATSQIEGAATTRRVAKEMLRTNRKPRDRSEQMIVNSYRTIQLLRQRLMEPLSLELLFEIQASITRDTLDDPSGAGRFRRVDEDIQIVDIRDGEVMHVPPPAEQLPERVNNMLKFANAGQEERESFLHPLVRAAILHFWLAYEHPFVDGNGRTARALLYWYMLKHDYWLFEFLTLSRVIVNATGQYAESFLYSETDENDLTYSVTFQLRAVRKALAALREYLANKQAEQQSITLAIRQYPGLNTRQRALLQHALRNPHQVYTFQSHQGSHGITLVTARKDLTNLAERGLLTEIKQGRQRGFIPAPDLEDRLNPRKAPKPTSTKM